MAGLKTIVGGEINSYTQMIDEARTIATNRMIEEATKLYDEKFVEKNKCILVYNNKLPFILFEFLEETRNYKPLFNTS